MRRTCRASYSVRHLPLLFLLGRGADASVYDIKPKARGYNQGDIVMLTDDATDYQSMPTNENIVSNFFWSKLWDFRGRKLIFPLVEGM